MGDAPVSPGSQIGGFRVVKVLGSGGMGVVYEVEHVETGGRCALKTLLPGADVEWVERFRREGEAQARVGAHANVVSVHSLDIWEGRLCLLMDLAEGGDLEERLRAGPLSSRSAATLARDLALALAHTHAAGILHRDLKPANVLFDATGTPKLVDFGLAHVAGAKTLTQTGTILGTPSYMAPEQATASARVGPSADVYGLGALLYATLTGGPPFERGSVLATLIAIRDEPPTPPSALAPSVDSELEAICLKCLAKSPAARYPTADALAVALTTYLSGAGAQSNGSPRRTTLIVASLVAVLLVAFAAAVAPRSAAPAKPGVAKTDERPSNVPALSGDVARPPESPADATEAPRSEQLADQANYDAAKVWVEALEAKPPEPMRLAAEHTWYRKLANRLVAGAGKGAPESPRYARVIFLKAAELGDGDAALALARMLLDGKGGTPGSAERDRAQGLVYAARALELGNARALRTLSFRYREQLKADLALEMAVQLEEAERGGESTAPLRLAQALNNLERPPWTQIVALCKRALSFASVDGGDRANCMRLLELANRSLGALPEGAPKEVNPIAPRAKRAEVLLTRAQELGQAADPTSLFEARLHTHLAARLRNPKAMRSIASQMREGVGGPVDLTLARLWEQRAHEAE